MAGQGGKTAGARGADFTFKDYFPPTKGESQLLEAIGLFRGDLPEDSAAERIAVFWRDGYNTLLWRPEGGRQKARPKGRR